MDFIYKTCGKSYKFQSSLSRHGRIHKALRVVCNCGISFSRQDSLRRHQFLSITCRALENAEENVHNTLQATPTIQNENLTDEQHSETSDDIIIIIIIIIRRIFKQRMKIVIKTRITAAKMK